MIHCIWEKDGEEYNWETLCKRKWTMIDGGLRENGVKYCPYCGGKIVELHKDKKSERLNYE